MVVSFEEAYVNVSNGPTNTSGCATDTCTTSRTRDKVAASKAQG